MNRWQLWAGMLLGLLVSARAQAGPIFSYAFDQPSYNVAVFGTVDVTVFLSRERHGPAHQPAQWLPGLPRYVQCRHGGRCESGAMMTVSIDVTPNPAFPLFTRSVTFGEGNLFESAGLGPDVLAAGSGPVYQIEVGVFQFTGMTPGIATLTASVDAKWTR